MPSIALIVRMGVAYGLPVAWAVSPGGAPLAGAAVSVPAAAVIAAKAEPMDPAAAWARVLAFYRSGSLGERIVIRAVAAGQSADGLDPASERVAVIEAWFDAGSPDRPPRVRLDLGRLIVSAGDGVARVVSKQDPQRYVETSFDGALTMSTLLSLAPPVPAPQLAWVLGSGFGESVLPQLEGLAWTLAAEMENGWVRIEGSSPRADVILITESVGRIRHMEIRGRSGGMIEIAASTVSPPPPHIWALEIDDRTRVGNITELSPPPPDVQPGARVPNLGLMTPDMLAWSLSDALASSAVGPGDREQAAAAVVVLFRADDVAAEEAARAGLRAARDAKARLERRGLMGEGGRIGMSVHPVAVLDVSQFSSARVREISQRWGGPEAGSPEAAAPSPEQPLWTSSGQTLMDRFARGASALLLLIDAERRLIEAIPLEGRAGEVEAIRAEIEGLLRSRIDPVILPDAAPPPSDPQQENPDRAPGGG